MEREGKKKGQTTCIIFFFCFVNFGNIFLDNYVEAKCGDILFVILEVFVSSFLVECTKQCTTSSLPHFQLFHCSRLTKLLLITFSGKHALPQSEKMSFSLLRARKTLLTRFHVTGGKTGNRGIRMFHGKTFECLSFHFAFGIKAVPRNCIEYSLSGAMVTHAYTRYLSGAMVTHTRIHALFVFVNHWLLPKLSAYQ